MLIITELATVTSDVLAATSHLIGAVPDPGSGTAPPGSGKVLTLLKWVSWLVSAGLVVGVLAVVFKMALGSVSGNHHSGANLGALGMVLMAAVIFGAAPSIIDALV